jgi:hypothetical protein
VTRFAILASDWSATNVPAIEVHSPLHDLRLRRNANISGHLVLVPGYERLDILCWFLALYVCTSCVGSWHCMSVHLVLVHGYGCLDILSWFLTLYVCTSCVGSWLWISGHLVAAKS